jgi:hypothetical protein
MVDIFLTWRIMVVGETTMIKYAEDVKHFEFEYKVEGPVIGQESSGGKVEG